MTTAEQLDNYAAHLKSVYRRKDGDKITAKEFIAELAALLKCARESGLPFDKSEIEMRSVESNIGGQGPTPPIAGTSVSIDIRTHFTTSSSGEYYYCCSVCGSLTEGSEDSPYVVSCSTPRGFFIRNQFVSDGSVCGTPLRKRARGCE